MERLAAITVLLLCAFTLRAEEDPLYRLWSERQAQGDLAGAMEALLDVLSERPGNLGALNRMDTTSRAIEKQERELDALAREDRGPAVDNAQRVLAAREKETRRALDSLRASYEHNWRTTPESLLHTCRGLDLQLQITLPDDAKGVRIKNYVRDLSVSLSSGAAAGRLPGEADVHRVAGFLAYERVDRNGALSEWKKALDLEPTDARLAEIVRETEGARKKEERRAMARGKMALAEQHYLAGDYRAALALYRESAKLDPVNRFAVDEAKRIEEILQKETNREDLGRRLGRAREAQAQGRQADAVREWLAVLKEDPLNTEARENLGRLSHAWGTSPAKPANVPATGPSAQERERASEYYSRGLMEYSRGDLVAAQKAFERSVALAPADEMAARALERVMRQLKNRP
ncbi:MAG: hypothetical protein IPN90_01700 [Elusimicrobia bacterium]|nr:hypothetical protein [Elusimicrobiota bacterium]